jgi:hypothetical protein
LLTDGIKDLSLGCPSSGAAGGGDNKRTESKGDSYIRPGSAGLKNLARIAAHGVFGPGVACPPWVLNPARMNKTVGGTVVNDGMVGCDCIGCVAFAERARVGRVALHSKSIP